MARAKCPRSTNNPRRPPQSFAMRLAQEPGRWDWRLMQSKKQLNSGLRFDDDPRTITIAAWRSYPEKIATISKIHSSRGELVATAVACQQQKQSGDVTAGRREGVRFFICGTQFADGLKNIWHINQFAREGTLARRLAVAPTSVWARVLRRGKLLFFFCKTGTNIGTYSLCRFKNISVISRGGLCWAETVASGAESNMRGGALGYARLCMEKSGLFGPELNSPGSGTVGGCEGRH